MVGNGSGYVQLRMFLPPLVGALRVMTPQRSAIAHAVIVTNVQGLVLLDNEVTCPPSPTGHLHLPPTIAVQAATGNNKLLMALAVWGLRLAPVPHVFIMVIVVLVVCHHLRG